MKTLPKKIGDYATYEELAHDYQQTDQFLSLSRAQRIKQLDRLKDTWMVKHSERLQQTGAEAKDLTGTASAIMDKILETVGGKGTGTSLLESQLPRDNIQLAIDLALFGIGPEALAGKVAYRILAPTIAGAIGGITTNEGAVGGAARGLGEAAGGELITGGIKTGAYLLRKRALPSLDFSRVAGWLEQRFGTKIPDMTAFRKLFNEGEIVNQTQREFDKVHAQVSRKLGKGFKIQVPVMPSNKTGVTLASPQSPFTFKVDMTLDEAAHHLHTLENEGWNLRGEPITSHAGAFARDAAHDIEGSIAEQIDSVNKKLSVQWYTAHGRLKEAKTLRNLFTTKGAVDEHGPVMHVLQALSDSDTKNSFKHDLVQSMGPDGQKSFRDMLFRGAEPGSLTDRPGKGLFSGKNVRVSTHGSIYAHPNLPYPTRHVGDVPYDLGKGRALRAVATIGPYQLIQNAKEMTSLPPTKIVPAGPGPSASASPIPTMHITKSPEEMKATIAGAG